MASQTQHISYDKRNSHNRSWKLKLIRGVFNTAGKVAPEWTAEKAVDKMLTVRKKPMKAQELNFLQTAEQVRIPYLKGQMRGYRWGQGPKVLVTHGWESSTARMRLVIKHLVESGYEVFAFDAPAHGLSTGEHCNIFAYSNAILDVLHKFGPFHAVVGHSFGATSTVFLLGQLTDIPVNRLVFNGMPPSLSLMTHWFVEAVNLTPQVEDLMHKVIETRYGWPVMQVSLDEIANNITVPTLIFHDRDDTTVPLDAAYPVYENWDSAELRITQGLGHRGALQSRDIFDQITEFIGQPIEVPAQLAGVPSLVER